MITLDDFNQTITIGFWKHIKKNTYVPWNKFPNNKEKALAAIYNKLNNGTYTPSPPRDYVVSNKHNAVARIVPSLTLEDYCLYFYCVAKLEKYIAGNRTEGTYGGFRMGGVIRKLEESEFEYLESEYFSSSPFSYNLFAWFSSWKDFQKKSMVFGNDKKYKYFLKFDIANFYNTISLTILEKKIRTSVPMGKTDIVDLLFFFLKFWNKKFLQYKEQTISIPQDEVGDCSRILANFYLQEYDKYMKDLCDREGCKYLRYADDQIIFSPNKEIAESILFDASKELFKINLNINSSKVDRFYNRSEWNYYWCFNIFNLLSNKQDSDKINTAVKYTLKLNKEKCRYNSVLKLILSCNMKKISLFLRIKIFSEILTDEFVLNSDARILKKIYDSLDNNLKKEFINKLDDLVDTAIFNSFHYELLRAKKSGVPIKSLAKIKSRIKELKL